MRHTLSVFDFSIILAADCPRSLRLFVAFQTKTFGTAGGAQPPFTPTEIARRVRERNKITIGKKIGRQKMDRKNIIKVTQATTISVNYRTQNAK
jgi:hypothetical protein